MMPNVRRHFNGEVDRYSVETMLSKFSQALNGVYNRFSEETKKLAQFKTVLEVARSSLAQRLVL